MVPDNAQDQGARRRADLPGFSLGQGRANSLAGAGRHISDLHILWHNPLLFFLFLKGFSKWEKKKNYFLKNYSKTGGVQAGLGVRGLRQIRHSTERSGGERGTGPAGPSCLKVLGWEGAHSTARPRPHVAVTHVKVPGMCPPRPAGEWDGICPLPRCIPD